MGVGGGGDGERAVGRRRLRRDLDLPPSGQAKRVEGREDLRQRRAAVTSGRRKVAVGMESGVGGHSEVPSESQLMVQQDLPRSPARLSVESSSRNSKSGKGQSVNLGFEIGSRTLRAGRGAPWPRSARLGGRTGNMDPGLNERQTPVRRANVPPGARASARPLRYKSGYRGLDGRGIRHNLIREEICRLGEAGSRRGPRVGLY